MLKGSSLDGVSWSSGTSEVMAVNFLHQLNYLCALLQEGVTEYYLLW